MSTQRSSARVSQKRKAESELKSRQPLSPALESPPQKRAKNISKDAIIKQLRTDLAKLDKVNKTLAADVEDLKDMIQLQEPLVHIGVAIRRRWYEIVREKRHERAVPEIVGAGELAAYKGNLRADMAMFKLGYMKSADPTPASILLEGSPFEAKYKNEYFNNLYAYAFNHLVLPSKHGVRNFSRKMLEICDMSATLAAYYQYSATKESADAGLEKFRRLGIECAEEDKRLAGLFPIPADRYSAFDSWPTVDEKFREMKKVVEEVILRLGESVPSHTSWFPSSAVDAAVYGSSVRSRFL
ncbi:hypothetical protein QTJ16_001056 [Diplocarpon rosae]|uniref:Uncharacterized protein n=1 Tax=Diplocarpon rosae TaxID=946125 RepID=A0AAD9T6T1_9HELO|nr:hypothetical protein QTJ16_001056 [Diplocarpon rosae]